MVRQRPLPSCIMGSAAKPRRARQTLNTPTLRLFHYHALQGCGREGLTKRIDLPVLLYVVEGAGLQGVQGLIGQGATDIFSDNLNPRHDYGPTGFDRPQMFTGSVVYALPALRGANAFERSVLGGWSVEPIITFTSGVPVVPMTGLICGELAPIRTAPTVSPGQPCRAHGTGIESQWINPNAFSLYGLPLGTDGNASVGTVTDPARTTGI